MASYIARASSFNIVAIAIAMMHGFSGGYNCSYVSYIAVAMYSRDRYEIIGLRKISHFIKQPCKNVCLEKAL